MTTHPSSFQTIIIGSGIAGLICALESTKHGSVLIVTKADLTTSNTWYAQGGIAAVAEEGSDTIEQHIQDTLAAGQYHNNKKAVVLIAGKAKEAIETLENYGIHFIRKSKKKFDLHREGGHSFARILHTLDTTGRSIEEMLAEKVRKHSNITIREKTFVQDIMVKQGKCYGVKIFPSAIVSGRKIVIATGGLGYLFAKTTNPPIATGDGIAMAYRAGAKLKDLEFIQFHPTALDKANNKKNEQVFLLSEALRGAGAHLINEKNERFMEKYDKALELAPRDIVARSIFLEQQKGSRIYLDLETIGKEILLKKYPAIIEKLRHEGLSSDLKHIPISPAAHYSCGGIETNLEGTTSIDNLYAIGEVAYTGLHGANRLASNSLLEGVVMGKIVGNIHIQPEKTLTDIREEDINSPDQPQHTLSRNNLKNIRNTLRETMWKFGGIIRTKKGLTDGIKVLKDLIKSLPQTSDDRETAETKNMVETGLLILKAALKRRKSLGCHWIE